MLFVVIGILIAFGLLDLIGRGVRSIGLAMAGRPGGADATTLGAITLIMLALGAFAAVAAGAALGW